VASGSRRAPTVVFSETEEDEERNVGVEDLAVARRRV
jgi:hypothetical protein